MTAENISEKCPHLLFCRTKRPQPTCVCLKMAEQKLSRSIHNEPKRGKNFGFVVSQQCSRNKCYQKIFQPCLVQNFVTFSI